MGVKGRACQGAPESLVWEDPPLTPLSACRPQARDRKMAGDLTGAQSFASTARCLNIWALVLGLLLTVTFVILVSTGSLVIFETVSEMVKHYGGS